MPGVYRTAQGKLIDLDKLIHKNEMTLAVGNMRVNARGDKVPFSSISTPPAQNLTRKEPEINLVQTPVQNKPKVSREQKTENTVDNESN